MTILQIPTSDRLYLVLWHARRQEESIPELVVRTLIERFLGQPIPVPSVPSLPLLEWVQVIE